MIPVDPRNLKVGLYLPNGDGLMSPGIHRWSDVLRLTRKTEDAGLDSVWVADHMIFRHEGHPTEGRWECWQMLGAMAAVTSRVEIGPLVCCMGFRNPALLAKIAETTDEISDGRLILGLGAGWHEPEFTSYGYPYDHRASRFEEGFKVLYDLIRTGESDFHGLYYTTDRAEMKPRGPRNGQIPIMIGTDGARMLQLTAKYANSWNTTWTRTVEEVLPGSPRWILPASKTTAIPPASVVHAASSSTPKERKEPLPTNTAPTHPAPVRSSRSPNCSEAMPMPVSTT